jgi:MYXO-CTERM domain-containing protein
VNGDGYDDVIIGEPWYDPDPGLWGNGVGAAYVHHGCVDGDGDGAWVGGDLSLPQDCDDADPTIGEPRTLYVDADGDGLGSEAPVESCVVSPGMSENADDCDDADAAIGALVSGYVDADGDGLGVLPRVELCEGTWSHADNADDCDDADPSIGAEVLQWADFDGDGFGDQPDRAWACPGTPGWADNGRDCDDTRSDVNPEAPEVCDGGGSDEDCDGLLDDADPSVDPSTFAAVYPDADGDGFGDASLEPGACEAPAGHVADGGDCDDGDAGVHPTAEEVPGDGVDQDCDGVDAAEDPAEDDPADDDPADDDPADDDPADDDPADDDPADDDPAEDDPSDEAPSEDAPSDDAPAKSGCTTAPASPPPWLAAMLALPALRRRRRG